MTMEKLINMETKDPFNLERFVKMQEYDYATALEEMKRGHKESHWIWCISSPSCVVSVTVAIPGSTVSLMLKKQRLIWIIQFSVNGYAR